MSAPVPSTRPLALAIGTAAASATLAIGVTAASLLGWFRSAEPPAPRPVPETSDPAPTPAASPENLTDPVDEVQLVMKDDDDHDRRERGREHEGEEDDDDD